MSVEQEKKFAKEVALLIKKRWPKAKIIEDLDSRLIPVVFCEVNGHRHHIRFLKVQGYEHNRFDREEQAQ